MGMRVPFAKHTIGAAEIEAVTQTLRGRYLTNAGKVREFEELFRGFCGGGFSMATSSCMAALHLATLTLVRPGDEVIVPALTHPATALCVSLVGAKAVFVDVSRETGNMTPEAIKEAITEKTSAIMVLHFLGRPADMPAIMSLAREHDLNVIEDCALALGSFIEGRHVGLWGHAGCFSFYPAKHITTCEGGMLITRHPHVAEEIVERRHFGQKHERGSGMLTAVPDWVTLGMNCRMTEMQGALGVEQMKKLHDILDARRSNYNVLSHALADFEQIQSNGYSHYGLSAFIPDRDRVHAEMKRKNVETSIYYRTPVPHTTYYANYHKVGQFPNAEAISGETLCFSVGPHITSRAIAYMVETLRSCL